MTGFVPPRRTAEEIRALGPASVRLTTEEVRERLTAATSREEALATLENQAYTVAELRELAAGWATVTVAGARRRSELLARIVQGTVGFRLDAEAARRADDSRPQAGPAVQGVLNQGWPGVVADSADGQVRVWWVGEPAAGDWQPADTVVPLHPGSRWFQQNTVSPEWQKLLGLPDEPDPAAQVAAPQPAATGDRVHHTLLNEPGTYLGPGPDGTTALVQLDRDDGGDGMVEASTHLLTRLAPAAATVDPEDDGPDPFATGELQRVRVVVEELQPDNRWSRILTEERVTTGTEDDHDYHARVTLFPYLDPDCGGSETATHNGQPARVIVLPADPADGDNINGARYSLGAAVAVVEQQAAADGICTWQHAHTGTRDDYCGKPADPNARNGSRCHEHDAEMRGDDEAAAYWHWNEPGGYDYKGLPAAAPPETACGELVNEGDEVTCTREAGHQPGAHADLEMLRVDMAEDRPLDPWLSRQGYESATEAVEEDWRSPWRVAGLPRPVPHQPDGYTSNRPWEFAVTDASGRPILNGDHPVTVTSTGNTEIDGRLDAACELGPGEYVGPVSPGNSQSAHAAPAAAGTATTPEGNTVNAAAYDHARQALARLVQVTKDFEVAADAACGGLARFGLPPEDLSRTAFIGDAASMVAKRAAGAFNGLVARHGPIEQAVRAAGGAANLMSFYGRRAAGVPRALR